MTTRPVRLLLLTLAFSLQALASKLPTVFDGYITNMVSPTEFDVGARHVTCDQKTTYALDFVNPRSGLHDVSVSTHREFPLSVGLRVHVKGRFENKPDRFVAETIQAIPSEEEKTNSPQQMEGIALIQEAPLLQRDGQGWAGTLWLDGYPLQITEKTQMTVTDGIGAPFTGDKIMTNLWASYKATRTPDHSVHADSISFSANQIEAEEKKFLEKSEPQIEEPDYAKKIPGKIKFNPAWTLDILPDKDIQDYVTRVGKSLIPQYQKDLPDSDRTKIQFRFYTVGNLSKRWKATPQEISCGPSGTIIVPDNILAVLDSEAQLSALLSNCIAGILEKQLYRHKTRLKIQNDLGWVGALSGLYGLPLSIGDGIELSKFLLQLNEQASRIGLRSMLQNGYDIREAPFAWTVAANKQVRNPLDQNEQPSPLVASLMDDLRRDYSATPYSTLKTNREAYQQMLIKLRAGSPKLPNPKNAPGPMNIP